MPSFVSQDAFEVALARSGAKAPGTRASLADAKGQFDTLLFRIVRRLLDMLRVVAAQRTLQPEHVHSLAKLAKLLSGSVGAASGTSGTSGSSGAASGRTMMHGGHAGTVMTGSFFDPDNAADASSYSATQQNLGSVVFPQDSSAYIRLPLESTFQPLLTGGGSSSSSSGWLSDEALTALLREYKSRSAASADLRVSEAVRPLLRRLVEANAAAAIATCKKRVKGTKSKCVTATCIGKVASTYVVHL